MLVASNVSEPLMDGHWPEVTWTDKKMVASVVEMQNVCCLCNNLLYNILSPLSLELTYPFPTTYWGFLIYAPIWGELTSQNIEYSSLCPWFLALNWRNFFIFIKKYSL